MYHMKTRPYLANYKQTNVLMCDLVHTAWKVPKYWVISGPYFPVFGVNTEIYFVNLCIQYEYRKIRTRKNSIFGHSSRSDIQI